MLNKIRITMGLLLLAGTTIWFVSGNADAGSTTPGTVNDPLITKSYVDMKVAELKEELLSLMDGSGSSTVVETPSTVTETSVDMDEIEAYIDEQVEARVAEEMTAIFMGETPGLTTGNEDTSSDTSQPSGSGSSLFEVIEMAEGQRLVCGASAEVIVRAGSAIVIAGENGDGLANLTSGVDLQGGEAIPNQHHLLVSRSDGRGIFVNGVTSTGKAYILVKGDYTLE